MTLSGLPTFNLLTTALKDVKFFCFPTEKKQREAWKQATQRDKWIPNDYCRISQVHFISGRPSRNSYNLDFVPRIFSFSKENEEGTHSKKRARHDRYLKRLSMNITTPTIRPTINESEGNVLKMCAVQIVKV